MQVLGTPRSSAKTSDSIRSPFSSSSSASSSRASFRDGWMNMYRVCPHEDISLEKFEQLALKRLSILRDIEARRALSGSSSKTDDAHGKFESLLESSDFEDLQDPVFDNISHYALRIAFCKTEQLQRWFVTQELQLFESRLEKIAKIGARIKEFVAANDLPGYPISEANYSLMKEQLKGYYRASSQEDDEVFRSKIFEVRFQEILNLVRSKSVILNRGKAFIHQKDLIHVICSHFRSELRRCLQIGKRALNLVSDIEGDRLHPFLSNLSEYNVTKDYSRPADGSVTPDMLDSLAVHNFPLCMRHVHEKLRHDHHLKHFGRMQYGLFLKGIGLRLEDALRFWKEEFCKMMPVDKFEKQYAYNVRHNYGQEGKRTNYTPYGCSKIIHSNEPGDHGCPFKKWTASSLTSYLSGKCGVTSSVVDEIIELLRTQQYQLACRRYFQALHPRDWEEARPMTHPNQYFSESLNYTIEMQKQRNIGSSGSSSSERLVEPLDLD